MKTKSPFVLAAYSPQLRKHYEALSNRLFASNVSEEFVPRSFVDWFQERLGDWAAAEQRPHAYPHVFRKTALKRARIGEDRLQEVADDAKLTASVLIKHYAPDDDDLMRQASNRGCSCVSRRACPSMFSEVRPHRRAGQRRPGGPGQEGVGDRRLGAAPVLSAELAKRNGV